MSQLICLLALSIWATRAAAQLPERRLVSPLVFSTAFSEITAVSELSDGRVLLLDGREQTLQLVDLANASLRAVGRVGAGPGEYRRATELLVAGGDTTLVTDAGNGRLLIVAPDGSSPGVITRGGSNERAAWLATASDRQGRVYGTDPIAGLSTHPPRGPDSLALMRLDLASGRVVRVATVAAPPTKIYIKGSGKKIESVDIVRPPFAIGDQFGVAPDGRLAIARREPYRLDLVLPAGEIVHGAVVHVTRIPVGEDERAEYLETLPSAARARPETIPWPDALPPFPQRAVLALRNGETWVRRHSPARSATAWYDIFDRRGAVITRLSLSRNRRVLAVTARGTYVAMTDDDGLQHLEFYRGLRDDPG